MIFAGLTKNSTAYSPIAQSVEQWTVNPCVPGSSPGWRANQAKLKNAHSTEWVFL